MRFVLLTHYFPPELGAPQTRLWALARDLAARGAAVTVHTCAPHYPDGVIQAPYRNAPWMVEESEGVRIVRTPVFASHWLLDSVDAHRGRSSAWPCGDGPGRLV